MMKKLHFYLILPIFLGVLYTASGQTPEATYLQQTGNNAILYRGPLQLALPFRYNGTIFAYQETFSTGNLWYNHKFYSEVLLNLDAYRDLLYIKVPDGLARLVLEKERVTKFTLDHKEFINVPSPSHYPALRPGFYEVLYGGKDTLLKKIEKRYLERPGDTDARGIYRFFEEAVHYYLLKEGVVYPVKRLKACQKIYKEKKSEIQKFLRANPSKISEPTQFDLIFKQLMQFIDGKTPEAL